MPRRSNLLKLSLFLTLAGLCLFPSLTSAKPRIEFLETRYDLGEMYQNQEKSHVFKFKNTGSDTLTIENVKGG